MRQIRRTRLFAEGGETEVIEGLLGAGALVLGAAGVVKVVDPGPAARAVTAAELPLARFVARRPGVRAVGAGELAVAALVIFRGGVASAGLLALAYLLLAVTSWRLVRLAPGQDCGCFGDKADPVSRWHVAVTVVCAAVGVLGVGWPQPSVLAGLLVQGALAGPFAVATVLLAWLLYLVMTALPQLSRMTDLVHSPR